MLGQTLSHYRVRERLGTGATGEVFRIARLEALGAERFVDPCFVVWPLAALGEAEAALRALERARAAHSMWVHLAGVDPLRSDARFTAFLARMGLAA